MINNNNRSSNNNNSNNNNKNNTSHDNIRQAMIEEHAMEYRNVLKELDQVINRELNYVNKLSYLRREGGEKE